MSVSSNNYGLFYTPLLQGFSLSFSALCLIFCLAVFYCDKAMSNETLSNSQDKPIELLSVEVNEEAISPSDYDSEDTNFSNQDSQDDRQIDPRFSENSENLLSQESLGKSESNSLVSEELIIDTIADNSSAQKFTDSLGFEQDFNNIIQGSVWDRTNSEVIDLLFLRLPESINSETIRGLITKLLLSDGAPPQSSVSDKDFLIKRAKLLASFGDYNSAMLLLALSPEQKEGELFANFNALNKFGNLDYPRACNISKEWVLKAPTLFWKRANIFCKALEGDIEAALVGADLMKETGDSPGKLLSISLDTMAGTEAPKLDIGDLDENFGPFQLAMLRAAGINPPDKFSEYSSSSALSSIFESNISPVDLRLKAAEKAWTLGFISISDIRALYESVPFTPEELADPSLVTPDIDPSLARALLYRVVLDQNVPIARGTAISDALKFSLDKGEFKLMSQLLLPSIESIDPKPLFAWFAPSAVRALLSAGDYEKANTWYKMILAQAAAGPQNAAVAIELWPLIQLAGDNNELDHDMLDEWLESQDTIRDPAANERAGNLLSLFDALGKEVFSDYWLYGISSGPSIETVKGPSKPFDRILSDSQSDQRIGEVILLSAILSEADQHLNQDITTTLRIISAFSQIGLLEAAKSLALEVVLNNKL